MDGNRRYARTHKLETVEGHHLGFEALARILEVCYKSGVKVVTIYAFSIENFKRSKYEVDGLMDMAKTKLVQMSQHGELFDRYGASVRILGDKSLVREDVLEQVDRAVEMTRHNDQAVLNVCFPYTSREEITRSIRETVAEFSTATQRPRGQRGFSETHVLRNLRRRQLSSVAEEDKPDKERMLDLLDHGQEVDSSEMSDQDLDASSTLQVESSQTSHSPSPTLKPLAGDNSSSERNRQHYPDPETLTEDHLDKNTYTFPAPPLDLLVRTSGVSRLSDFMLWQCHEETEIKFLDCLWPEFDLYQFLPTLLEWQWRQRREAAEEIAVPDHMRASQWTYSHGGIDKNLKLNPKASLPKNAKSLRAGQTLVKVAYACPNPIDYKLADNVPFIFSKPATPCLDYSGIVVESKLGHLKTGELVFGKTEPPSCGALGEYIVVGKEGCVPVPNDVSLKDAACVGVVGLTAYQCIVPYAKKGDKVFINGGSGGTGTFMIQIAKAVGCHVTTTCSGPNVELCKSLGADEVVDYKTTDILKKLTSSGHNYDLIVDTVFATPALYWNAHKYLKPTTGRFVTIAGTPSISFIIDFLKVLVWPSVLGGGQRTFTFVTANTNPTHYAEIAKWMEEGKVKAVIEKEFELEDADKAFAHLKSGRTKGKVVVKVCEEEPTRPE
ncbi:hypothetical protein LTR78_004223 [Recurvomyces mirabilis]|uniref:Enoyl reductase (ER) domain-containing protein n=2 Tax=Recurvomyces mirabilis TaxID=574656 RepID=A0AAE1C2U2_9PEZI|nr:hypothetical protein LTR78_004223 [Recurvomyces mirabilis]